MAIPFNSNYEQTIPFSDTCAQLNLAAATNLAYTVPGTAANKYQVRFAYTSTAQVYVRKNTAAVLPGAGLATLNPYQEFRPGADGSKRYVQGGDTLNFISVAADTYVGISLVAIPN